MENTKKITKLSLKTSKLTQLDQSELIKIDGGRAPKVSESLGSCCPPCDWLFSDGGNGSQFASIC